MRPDPVLLSQQMLETARELGPGGNAGRVQAALTRLADVEPAEILGDDARIAFWINLYNAILLLIAL